MQTIALSPSADRGTVLHEIGHALGLLHEHQRPDRDQFITIHRDRVDPSTVGNTDVIDGHFTFGPYDMTSVMHYSSYTMQSP
jgi:hypothetical protein